MRATIRGGALVCLVTAAACADGDPGPRVAPARGTVGTEIFGVLCDRIGAGALREDLSGASYAAICHRDPTTQSFADHVDASLLPTPPDPAAATERVADIARVEALVPRRPDFIAALDAIVPAGVSLPVTNAAGTDACTTGETRALSDEVASFMARLAPSYDDGTIPEGTRSIARLVQAVQSTPVDIPALARLGARDGYRQEDLALGALRPALAYPGLRDLLGNLARLLSVDSQPGSPAPVPGPLVPLLEALTSAASDEAQTVTADAPLAPLTTTIDPNRGIGALSRARSPLEVIGTIVTTQDPAFGAGTTRPIVRRDVRGMATVVAQNGLIPAPFVDANGDGLADVGADGYFVTSNGASAPAPFLKPWDAPDGTTRDALGRALAPDGSLYYDTFGTRWPDVRRGAHANAPPAPRPESGRAPRDADGRARGALVRRPRPAHGRPHDDAELRAPERADDDRRLRRLRHHALPRARSLLRARPARGRLERGRAPRRRGVADDEPAASRRRPRERRVRDEGDLGRDPVRCAPCDVRRPSPTSSSTSPPRSRKCATPTGRRAS